MSNKLAATRINSGSSRAISLGRLILFLMMFSLLAENITGWMQMNNPAAFSVVQLYRSGMLLLIAFWLAQYWSAGFRLIVALLALQMVLMFYHSVALAGDSDFGLDLRFNLSLFSNFIYFIFFYGYLLKVRRTPRELFEFKRASYKIIRISFYIIAVNIVLGAFGIGYSTLGSYVIEDDVTSGGGKGFFIGGNDLSCVIMIVAGCLLIQAWLQRNLRAYLLFALMVLGLGVLVQLKTAILGTLILMMAIPIALSGVMHKGRLKLRPLIPLVLGIGFALLVLLWLIASNSALMRRALYLYEKEGLLTAISTGRTNFLSVAVDIWSAYYGLLDRMLGLGWSGFLEAMSMSMGIQKNVEIDYADILMMNGMLGLAVVLAGWFWYLRSNYKLIGKVRIAGAVLLIDLFLLLLAGLSGHILYSALNGMFVALLNILPLIDHEINQYEKSIA